MTNSTERLKARPVNAAEENAIPRAKTQDVPNETAFDQVTRDAQEQAREKQQFCFQLIDHETGHRSEPFTGSWEVMREVLDAREPGAKPHDDDYILLVAVLDEENTHIPTTPLITVKTYSEVINTGE